jgi:hypothetical protein
MRKRQSLRARSDEKTAEREKHRQGGLDEKSEESGCCNLALRYIDAVIGNNRNCQSQPKKIEPRSDSFIAIEVVADTDLDIVSLRGARPRSIHNVAPNHPSWSARALRR